MPFVYSACICWASIMSQALFWGATLKTQARFMDFAAGNRTAFHSLLRLPLCMDRPYFVYPFISCWTIGWFPPSGHCELFPPSGYCELCFCKFSCASFCLHACSQCFRVYIRKSRTDGSPSNPMFHLLRNSRQERSPTAWFHFYEMPGRGESKDTNSRLLIVRERDNGTWSLNGWWWWLDIASRLEATELHTWQWLKWWISYHAYFTTIKKKKRMRSWVMKMDIREFPSWLSGNESD